VELGNHALENLLDRISHFATARDSPADVRDQRVTDSDLNDPDASERIADRTTERIDDPAATYLP
jgi:hypothetical protein